MTLLTEQGELSMGIKAETCKRKEVLINLSRRAHLIYSHNLCWGTKLKEVGYPSTRSRLLRRRGKPWGPEVPAKHLNQSPDKQASPPYVQICFAILDPKMFCTLLQS